MTSEKARRNSLPPCSILASTSFLNPPLLSASEMPAPPGPPAVVVVVVGSENAAAVLLARFDSASSTCPRVSSAARVAPSSRLAESKRVTLAWSGFRADEVELLLLVFVFGVVAAAGTARPVRAGSGSSAGIFGLPQLRPALVPKAVDEGERERTASGAGDLTSLRIFRVLHTQEDCRIHRKAQNEQTVKSE